jgi:hypothetical protein
MKFTTIIGLLGAASAIHIVADPAPESSNNAAAAATKKLDTQKVGTTGGADTKTLQAKTPATTTASNFEPRSATWPKIPDNWNGLQDGQRFQIYSAMDGGRVLCASRVPIESKSTHPVGKYDVITHSPQFEVQFHESHGSAQEFWYWHDKTKTIRSIANGAHCLTWDHTQKALAAGVKAVVRPCDLSPEEKQGLRYVKETYSFVSDANAKICLATNKSANNEDINVTFATCADSDKSQNWYPMYSW